jgi:hypothetical protein
MQFNQCPEVARLAVVVYGRDGFPRGPPPNSWKSKGYRADRRRVPSRIDTRSGTSPQSLLASCAGCPSDRRSAKVESPPRNQLDLITQSLSTRAGAFGVLGPLAKRQDRRKRTAPLDPQAAGLRHQHNRIDQTAHDLARLGAVLGAECVGQGGDLSAVDLVNPTVRGAPFGRRSPLQRGPFSMLIHTAASRPAASGDGAPPR